MLTSTLSTIHQTGPLSQFLGGDATIINRESMPVNNFIKAERLDVLLPENEQAEDRGILLLYPIDDNKFCLQIYLMEYADGSSVSASVYSLRFLPAFFDQYPAETLMKNQPFRFDQTTELSFPVCAQTRMLLAQFTQWSNLTPFMRSLQQSETAIHLLRCSLECITIPFKTCQEPACRFLLYESERGKIQDARKFIDQHTDRPHTIKELARKVAMNECYLKKGFKAIVGKTIHEYQQQVRINKAKVLLQSEGCSVTDVANILGYSSISHFSTAFKRETGMKPCELLM
jgi:AraC-like DNA-binding protein